MEECSAKASSRKRAASGHPRYLGNLGADVLGYSETIPPPAAHSSSQGEKLIAKSLKSVARSASANRFFDPAMDIVLPHSFRPSIAASNLLRLLLGSAGN